MAIKTRTLTLTVATAAAAVTIGSFVLPGVAFAYRNPSLHVAIDTADGVIALMVAFLLFGRYGRSGRLGDLLLVYALLLFGLGNLFLSVVPRGLTAAARIDDLSTWGPLITRTFGGILLATAALASGRRARIRSHTGVSVVVNSAIIVALVAGIVIAFRGALPPAVEATVPVDAVQPNLDEHAMVVVLHVALMAMFGVASAIFTSIADRDEDELMRWFGAGAALAAFARMNYVLYPSLYSDFVYTGDFFRLGFYLFLLVGAAREIASYWEGLAESAATEERRRIARDLHDGLAQELAFMWGDVQELQRDHPDDERVTRASASAERALDESRRAIAAFTRAPNEPLDIAISGYIEDVAQRLQVRLRLDLAPGIEVPGKLREDLLRVAREAVTNGARHGRAETITVRLWCDEGIHLSIFDDGVGFDSNGPARNASFGLVSMRERVARHGGHVEITSAPGKGTNVEVVLP